MILDRVTITGADDTILPEALLDLAGAFPFVEWGILFSPKRQGSPRYPSPDWVGRLCDAVAEYEITDGEEIGLSAHLCGGWVRDWIAGNPSWLNQYAGDADYFQRVQLNFHGEPAMWTGAVDAEERQVIVQADGVNVPPAGMVPLFDVSGGKGALPLLWPKALPGLYCGYAGGLGPDNVVAQVNGPIADAAGAGRVWIDMETRVRTDERFDLRKVRQVLEQVAPLVVYAQV